MRDKPDREAERLDKWLWAARFFKTRSIAADAIKRGRIQVNGAKAKPAKLVSQGDQVSVRRDPFELVVNVNRLSARRGSAQMASGLYTETEQSRLRRETLAMEHAAADASLPRFKGRPSKRDRRALLQLKNRFEPPGKGQ